VGWQDRRRLPVCPGGPGDRVRPGKLERLEVFMTIGQMIEFLDEHRHDWFQQAFPTYYTKLVVGDLCDALWTAIKEVLESP
jgi:hypothetical protein